MSLGGCLYTQEDEEDEEDKEDEEDWETDSNASADSIEEYVFIGTRWVVPALSSEAEEVVEQEAEAVEQEAEGEAEAAEGAGAATRERATEAATEVQPLTYKFSGGTDIPPVLICHARLYHYLGPAPHLWLNLSLLELAS